MTARRNVVLVVDDDPDIRETLALLHEASGWAVLQAANGAEALQVLRTATSRPRLALLDLMMPVMDGRAFRVAQRLDPALREIPVVVLSGDGRVERKAEELEVAAWLRKPIGLEELLATVNAAC